MYENSDSYRKFVNLERYGLNPTFTYAPSAVTKIQLSYEYFHDQRTTDAASLHNWFSETPGPSSWSRCANTAAHSFSAKGVL